LIAAVAGICGRTRDPDGTATRAMGPMMRHRGPDDDGLYVHRDTGVALGTRRLSIIDVEGGHQPLSNENRDVWAALDGEIYNHRKLQACLRERGHRLATGTDTEVLVHLYEDYGEALVDALEGMYAFAVWDARRERVLLGRDRFGEKPLFYTERGGVLTFASELTALLAGEPSRGELDAESIDALFVHGYVPSPGTIVRGVRQLPPGHVLSWERGKGACTLRSYWTPPGPGASHGDGQRRLRWRSGEPGLAAAVGAGFVSVEELVAEAEALLEASVRSRMVSDVPLGVFLSGGSDSALVAGLAARASTTPIETFTVAYDGGEAEAARATARELGAEHSELSLTEADVAERAPTLLAALDQPLGDPALLALHAVAKLARREVTVALGGTGGGELLGRRTPAAGVRRPPQSRLYGPMLSSSGVGDRVSAAVPSWPPENVLVGADRATMLVSLELRTPYLQLELAELAAGVSTEARSGSAGKPLLDRLLGELVPSAGRRAKRRRRVPTADWLRGPLAPVLAEQVRAGAVFAEGWLDRHAVGAIVDEHTGARRDWSEALWPILALGLWLDRFRGRSAG
jgi:asparagine synthase (glutamine-hydrolysing)